MKHDRDTPRQLDKLETMLRHLDKLDQIGVDGESIYLEPGMFPDLTRDLAKSIKPVLERYRSKLMAKLNTHIKDTLDDKN